MKKRRSAIFGAPRSLTRAELQPGDQFRAGRRIWTKADDKELRARYPHEPTAVLAAALRRGVHAVYARAGSLGLEKSAAYLASPAACRLRRGPNPGVPFQYPKGHVPANKGLRRPGYSVGRMQETQFKKGQVSHTWKPIGFERLVDGYRYTKTSDIRLVPWTRNWRPTHFLVWEAVHGPIPPGHALAFRNRDRLDVRLENIELITRRELMARNTVHNLPKPLKQAVQLLGALKRQIRRKERGQEANRRSA